MQGDGADLLVRQRLALEQCEGNMRQLRQYFAVCLQSTNLGQADN
jgi:hypothetical protein